MSSLAEGIAIPSTLLSPISIAAEKRQDGDTLKARFALPHPDIARSIIMRLSAVDVVLTTRKKEVMEN